jgi:hypothetical protein
MVVIPGGWIWGDYWEEGVALCVAILCYTQRSPCTTGGGGCWLAENEGKRRR